MNGAPGGNPLAIQPASYIQITLHF
jgi:hypothetical protein